MLHARIFKNLDFFLHESKDSPGSFWFIRTAAMCVCCDTDKCKGNERCRSSRADHILKIPSIPL